MPLVNYCKKCKTEVPQGQTCPHCAGKLTAGGEQLSFGYKRRVVKDWFAWNGYLRILLPVLVLVMAVAITAEALSGGSTAVATLLSGGFLQTVLALLAFMLGLIWLLLLAQGVESVHVVLDKEGLHVRTYIAQNDELSLYAHFLTASSAKRLSDADGRPPLPGFVMVKRIALPWAQMRRVQLWREGSTVLFFSPSFWQVAAVRCSAADLMQLEGMARQKLKRVKRARVLPAEPKKGKKCD